MSGPGPNEAPSANSFEPPASFFEPPASYFEPPASFFDPPASFFNPCTAVRYRFLYKGMRNSVQKCKKVQKTSKKLEKKNWPHGAQSPT